MAFKLDKQEIARRERLVGELTEARGKLQDAISVFNAAVEELKAPLLAALESYNEVIEETRGFVEDIASAADGQFDDKSEKWQEGDKGQQVREWIDAWQNESFDAIELSLPEDLALEDEESDHDGRLENLPEAAEA